MMHVSDAVLVAAIAALATMYAATLPVLISIRKHAKAARTQVENSHTTNLRDDLDDKHSENTGRLGWVERQLLAIVKHLGLTPEEGYVSPDGTR